MRTFGIVAEFNPFHNGHQYLINTAQKLGATHIVTVMSGNFTQRGDCAVISKFARAKSALLCGADLVLEMPVGYSLSPAYLFAYYGICALSNYCDTVIFGSECGDINKLYAVCDILEGEDFKTYLENADKNTTFASLRNDFVKNKNGELAKILKGANDSLAIEYIFAARKLQKNLDFIAVKRKDALHDGKEFSDTVCSAEYIRNNLEKAEHFMPPQSYKILQGETDKGAVSNIKNLENAVLAFWRTADGGILSSLPDISEGIENRIVKAAGTAVTLEELYDLAKTKRYTHARIRRIVINGFLGITKDDVRCEPPEYIRILAINKKGEEILKNAKQIKAFSSLKDAEKISEKAKRQVDLEVKAGNIYALSLKNKQCANQELTTKIIKDN
ncbi:MAG: nucleotidyltransferase family protein [Oscillospiraceae bacterium]|nr:nucleotidyltransferase family protein [Candidatus Equicaccousia limihippi]